MTWNLHNEFLTSSMDSHLSEKDFEGVRQLTDVGRAAGALPLPVEAGTKVVFAGTLGAHLTYDDVPPKDSHGEVVNVKSANGDITHHDGKVFVKWDDGKFRPIHAEHLRLAGCEKLPEGPMRDNCEKKKEEGKEDEEPSKKAKKKLPEELEKHQFTSEDNPNPKGNDKDGDGKTNEPIPFKDKKAEDKEAKEKYPWDDCIADQMKEYGDKETAEKVCGAIKYKSQGKKAALIRLAATMEKGSEERRTILRMAKGQHEGSCEQAHPGKPHEDWEEASLKGIAKFIDKRLAKKKLPEELEKHQFTSEDNPNPKGNDKDGDGKTNEPSPLKDKKGALIRLASTYPVGSQERIALLKLIAGCDSPKLPEALREQCKKKEKEGEESEGKKAMRVASLGDLTDFLKIAEGVLVHKSTNDLWSFAKDADGYVVSRLFDDSGEPLKG